MMTQEEIDAILGKDSRSDEIRVISLTKNEDISIEEDDVFSIVKDVNSAIEYLAKRNLEKDLIFEYAFSPANSYSSKVAEYRLIVAALTVNVARNLTKGTIWYPLVQFCRPDEVSRCKGDQVIGTIECEGTTYTVVGGGVFSPSSSEGFGHYNSHYGVSLTPNSVDFLAVPSEEVAKYISKQFGRLLFEVRFGRSNNSWQWIN